MAGNNYLRSQTCVPIAMHAGNPPLTTALHEDVCDGFVLCGGVSQVLHESHVIAEHNKVFWLQLGRHGVDRDARPAPGRGLHATHRWPAVNCHNLYEHQLPQGADPRPQRLRRIPDGPGLGIEVDWDAVERFRIEPIPSRTRTRTC